MLVEEFTEGVRKPKESKLAQNEEPHQAWRSLNAKPRKRSFL